jgi:hypothetical protein
MVPLMLLKETTGINHKVDQTTVQEAKQQSLLE